MVMLVLSTMGCDGASTDDAGGTDAAALDVPALDASADDAASDVAEMPIDGGGPIEGCDFAGLTGGETGDTVTLSPTSPGEIYMPDLSAVGPGDVIAIPAGTYTGGIALRGFAGAGGAPVTILNVGGTVETPWIRISEGRHFRLEGRDASGYGFHVVGPSGTGVAIGRDTSDYEVTGIEVTGVDAGFYFKVDPDAAVPSTIHPAGAIANVWIHHNHIHDVPGEGMYIGHTYPNADPYHGDLVPLRMENVHIWANVVEDTGWDGIQLSNARSGAVICGNVVRDFGLLSMDSQRAGIILGGNTEGDVFGNLVENGTGNAIEVFGYGECTVHDNVILDTATLPGEDVIYVDGRPNAVETNPGLRVVTERNVIRNGSRSFIRHANNDATMRPGVIADNQLCDALDRPLASLITTGAGDEVSGNVIAEICDAP